MLNGLRIVLVMFIAGAAAMTYATPSSAQESPALAITTIDPSGYPTITAVVTALDASGAPVTDLTAGDLQAFEGDTPIAVTDLRTERLSLSVAVVIDVSGSMQGSAIASAKAAAQEFVQNLAPTDSASIFAFSTAVRQVAPFTSDKAQMAAAIDGLQAAGDTSLFEAAQAAVFATIQLEAPRKAVVLMTDGENVSPSPVTSEGALAVARDARIPVYSIGFGPGPDTSFLQTIAEATNGQYRAADAGSIGAVYGDITRLLNSEYTLTLQAPAEGAAAAPSVLRITAPIGGATAEASAPFDRPGVAAPTAPAVSTAPVGDEESSSTPLIVFGGVAGALALGAIVVLGTVVLQRTRTRQRQLAVVAPNLEQAQSQGMPQAPGGIVMDIADGEGRLMELDAPPQARPPQAYDFASTPIRVGSAHDCEVRVPASPDVASRHAAIWMRDGKIMLRHTGGTRRPTLVAGRPVDWVILEHGDEFVIGPHRYRAELR